MGVAVLDGDVYVRAFDGFKISYDNWYCDREISESEENYVMRSVTTEVLYIESYQPSPSNVLFSVVSSI